MNICAPDLQFCYKNMSDVMAWCDTLSSCVAQITQLLTLCSFAGYFCLFSWHDILRKGLTGHACFLPARSRTIPARPRCI